MYANVLNAQFASGTGTAGDPYIILTSNQLYNFAIAVNSGTSYSGKYIELGNNIDVTLNDPIPGDGIPGYVPSIGHIETSGTIRPFQGNFNGKGYYLIRKTSIGPFPADGRTNFPYAALFGYTDGATIKNIHLSNCDTWGGWIDNTPPIAGDGGHHIGGIIGYSNNTTISNCSYSGTVYSPGYNVGGLIGYANNSTVVNCFSSAYVVGTDSVGGFVGCATGNTTFTNCYSTSAVRGINQPTNTSKGGDYVGGFAGVLGDNCTLTDVYTTGYVTGRTITDAFAQKSIGTTITDSYFDTDISEEITANATSLSRTDFYNFSNFNTWVSGTDSANPWVQPAVSGGAGRPYMFYQKAMLTNNTVNKGAIKNNSITIRIKRTTGSTISIVKSGIRYHDPNKSDKIFTYLEGGETTLTSDYNEFNYRITGLEGGTYYVQPYFIDNNGIYYFGDMIKPEIVPEHNVTYQANDASRVGTATGTVTDANNPHIESFDVTVLSNSFSLTGYTFSTWNTLPNGSGTNRAPGSTFAITDSTPLYAQWTPINYTITYFNTFGASNPNPATYTIEGDLAFQNITRTGYTFNNWYSNVGLSSVITGLLEGEYGNKNIYAGWTANQYKIIFDKNGGTGSMSDLNVTYDQSTTLTANTFTRTGYHYTEWKTSAGSGTSYSNSATFTYTIDGNLRLYAQWEPNNYTITFNKNAADASGSMSNQTIPFETATALTANAYSRAGYIFGGWTTNADGTGSFYSNSGNITITSPANITLYAKWVPNTSTQYKTEHYRENIADNNYTLNESVTAYGKTDSVVNAVIKTYTGFTQNLTHPDRITSDSIAGDGSTVLKVYYSRTRHTVTFNSQGGSSVSPITNIKYGATITLPTAPTKTGYTFDSWKDNADGSGDSFTSATVITANRTVYAKWNLIDYTINYNLLPGVVNHIDNPGTYNYEQTITLKTPTRTGYTFGGWYNNSGFTGSAITSIPLNSTGNKDFWAKWTAINYTLTYFNLGAANNGANPSTYTITSNIDFANITQTGYNFNGWYSDAALTIPYNSSPDIVAGTYGNKNIYAQWDTIRYNITYNLNSGTNNVSNPSTYIHNNAVTFAAPSRIGYTFEGWFTNAGMTAGNETTGIPQYTTGAKEVWAKWSPNEYTITFNANTGNGGSMTPQTVEYEVAENLNSVGFTKTGHTFNGWATTAGGDSAYANQDTYTLTTPNNITLYATWKANTYNVLFDSNHAGTVTGSMPNQAMVFGQATALNTNNFAVSGYSFTGWNTQSNGSGTTYSNGGNYTITTAGNETIYAQWVAGTATGYKVEHYRENLDGTYSVFETENLSGRTDDPISATIKTYTGFTHYAGHSSSVLSGTIAGDGTTVLKAYYTRTLHTVTFNSQGGTAVSAINNIKYGATISLPAAPTRTGYTFNEWNTTADGISGTQFTTTSVVTANITVYAQWLLNTYNITYVKNSGTHSNTPATYTYETATFSFTNPTRTGYTFQGWFTNIGMTTGNEITGITKNTRTGDLTIYAKWSLNTYTITYHNNDNDTDLGTNPATYNYEGAVTFTDTITRTGFGFLGWFQSNLSTPFTGIPVNSTGNKDVYIKWDTLDYKITYNLNFGTNSISNPPSYTFENGVTYANATREGYHFDGWFSDEGLTITTTGITINSTGERTVWAKWIPKTYDIVFEKNSGTGTMSNQQAQYTVTETLNANEYTRTGYTFSNWSTLADGTGVNYNNLSDYTISTPDNDTVYAQWNTIDYTINYITNGGLNNSMNPATYTIEDSVIFDPASKAGYNFKGWYTDVTMLNDLITKIDSGSIGEITIYARWEKEGDYKIDYFMGDNQKDLAVNGSSNPYIYNVETETITFENAWHPGYTFTGWETNTGTSITQLPKGSVGDTALFAIWTIDSTANRFNITYDIDGGTNSINNPSSYFFDTDTIFFENPIKNHYTFNGWYGDSLFTVNAPYIAKGSFSDTTIYAQWIILPENGFSITYQLNGGTNSINNPDSFNIETPTITFENATRRGYSFGGWYADNSYSTQVNNLPTGSVGDTILYAQWTIGSENTYSITYELNNGNNSASNPSVYNVETPTITFDNATRTGYTFGGWFTDNSFATQVIDLPAGTIGDTILYAQWLLLEANNYTINYELNGGTNSDNNPAVFNIETADITFEAPTRNGYIFNGWYSNQNMTTPISGIPTGSVGDTTIYAKWVVSIEIICKWGYVLLVNDPDNLLENKYQWYKDGAIIPGATQVSYAGPNKTLCGSYSCDVTPVNANAGDGAIRLEPYIASNCGTKSVNIYPSVMSSSSLFNIEIIDTEYYSDYVIEIYDLKGVKLYNQISEPNSTSEIISPFAAGCYIVKISNSNGTVKTEKITVE